MKYIKYLLFSLITSFYPIYSQAGDFISKDGITVSDWYNNHDCKGGGYIDFCSTGVLRLYHDFFEKKLNNFNKNYQVIFLKITPSTYKNERFPNHFPIDQPLYGMAVLDLKNKKVMPQIQVFSGFNLLSSDGIRPPKFKFSKNSKELCVIGSGLNLKDAFVNGMNCYQFYDYFFETESGKNEADFTPEELKEFKTLSELDQ